MIWTKKTTEKWHFYTLLETALTVQVINRQRAWMCSGEKWTTHLHLSGSGCHGLKQPSWKWRGEIAIKVIKGWTLSSVDAWITFHYFKLGCKWTSPLIYNGTFQSVRPELKTWKAVYIDESSRKDLNPEEQPAPALLEIKEKWRWLFGRQEGQRGDLDCPGAETPRLFKLWLTLIAGLNHQWEGLSHSPTWNDESILGGWNDSFVGGVRTLGGCLLLLSSLGNYSCRTKTGKK